MEESRVIARTKVIWGEMDLAHMEEPYRCLAV